MDAQTRVGWKFTVRRAAVLLMLVLVALSGVLGERPAPAAAQTPSTTSLSYQGQVFNNGARFTATCSFQFALYDAATGGNAVGPTQTVDNVSVRDSYFSLQLDFGASPFGGGARYLDLAVKCPPETSFTPMTSRIPLTAVPMALSAPWSGLTGVPTNLSFLSSPTTCKDGQVAKWNSTASAWACGEVYAGSDTASSWNLNGNLGITPATNFLGTTDAVSMTFKVNNQTALRLSPGGASGTDTPNVIGGYSGNSVAKGVKGATIGGGGRADEHGVNTVTADYGTVGGGYNNTASWGDTVGGGYNNNAYSWSDGSAASGGSTVGGGTNNTASGNGGSTVGGGKINTASGYWATIGGGGHNTASNEASTVGGGGNNTASGSVATIGGGGYNIASGDWATIPGGYKAAASLYGQLAYASGSFTGLCCDAQGRGDAQTSVYVLRQITTALTPTELYLDGGYESPNPNQRLTLASGRTYAFSILVAAETSGGSQGAGYKIEGVIKNAGGTMSFIGTPTTTVLGEDNSSWDVQVAADDTNKALVIKAIGAASTTIRWVATVRTTEVGY